jgi:hypothetical protein
MEYIDKDKLLDRISYLVRSGNIESPDDALTEIENEEIVDAEQVLRCKDCIYCYKQNGYTMCSGIGEGNQVEDDGYCKWGRKEW